MICQGRVLTILAEEPDRVMGLGEATNSGVGRADAASRGGKPHKVGGAGPGTKCRGRYFGTWLGLAPRQITTGGKPRLGKTSKMGQRGLSGPCDHRGHDGCPAGKRTRRGGGFLVDQNSGAQAEKCLC